MNELAKKAELLHIRPFERKDAEGFLKLGRFLHGVGHYKTTEFDVPKVLWLFTQVALGNPDYWGKIVESDTGEIVGCFVGQATPYYFSHQKIASDLCFGLLPGHRATASGVMFELIAGFEAWAKEIGAFETCIATSAGGNGPRLEPFLNSLGYETVGFTTKKRII
jgi:hypothetical protein